jgi:hypothetical protein
MARVKWLSLMCVCFSLSAVALANDATDVPRGRLVKVDGLLLTVKAKEILQRQILEEIAKQLNFELIIHGSLEERHSFDLEGGPWEEALKKTLFPANGAFIYEPAPGGPRLSKVLVLPAQQDRDVAHQSLPVPAREGPPPLAPIRSSEAQSESKVEQGQVGLNTPLTKLLKAEDVSVRAAAIGSIAAMGGEGAVDALMQALQDQEPWIRLEAVEALTKIGGQQSMQGLQQALKDDILMYSRQPRRHWPCASGLDSSLGVQNTVPRCMYAAISDRPPEWY